MSQLSPLVSKVLPQLMSLASTKIMPITTPSGVAYNLLNWYSLEDLLDPKNWVYEALLSYSDTEKFLNMPLEEMPRYLGSEKRWQVLLATWRLSEDAAHIDVV